MNSHLFGLGNSLQHSSQASKSSFVVSIEYKKKLNPIFCQDCFWTLLRTYLSHIFCLIGKALQLSFEDLEEPRQRVFFHYFLMYLSRLVEKKYICRLIWRFLAHHHSQRIAMHWKGFFAGGFGWVCVFGVFLFVWRREREVCYCLFWGLYVCFGWVFCCCFLFGLGVVFSGFCVILGGVGFFFFLEGVEGMGALGYEWWWCQIHPEARCFECVKDKMIIAILFN